MHVNDLPPELLSSIFQLVVADHDSLSKSDLTRRAKQCRLLGDVCKEWNEATTSMLYARVCLKSPTQARSFNSALVHKPELGSRPRVLRLSGDGVLALTRDVRGARMSHLEQLYLSATKTISFDPIFSFKNLSKLVMWGVTLESDPRANSDLSLPSLRELSFCGVKNLACISKLLTRSNLPSIRHVAVAYSPIPQDNFLSSLPVETIVVATSEARRSLLPAAADTTLYTNRFYSISEGYTDLGRLPMKHLQLSDFEGPLIFPDFLQLTSHLNSDARLETIYLPESCRLCKDIEQVQEWCGQRKINLVFEEEVEFMHESLVPQSFKEIIASRTEKDRL
ncbi:hypothetical protein JCM16303_000990 [Sporobolomyces ruberrimus]